MRNGAAVMLGIGILAFLYCGDRAQYDLPPKDTPMEESLRFYEGPRWELGRWAGALVAAMGGVFLMLPRGR